MNHTLKALLLIGMGLFLYSRYWLGTLSFYINTRFAWFTVFAAAGLVIVGLSYLYYQEGHQHGRLTWAGIGLIIAPILLGLIIPPRPLGAAAMSNREINLETITSVTPPESTTLIQRPSHTYNILDWLLAFRSTSDPSTFAEQRAKVVGFVYRDERFQEDTFMVSRFIISCCAADATPLGLVVQSPQATSFLDDQWVEVDGHFKVDMFNGQPTPILVTDIITETNMPEQPYLYP